MMRAPRSAAAAAEAGLVLPHLPPLPPIFNPNFSTGAFTSSPPSTTMILAPPLRRVLLGRASHSMMAATAISSRLPPRCYSSSSPSDGSKKTAPASPLMSNSTVTPSQKNTIPTPPFVPSTAHLHPEDIALSTFFALHRPLSISKPLPPTSPATLDSLFTPASSTKKLDKEQRNAEAASEGGWDWGMPFQPPVAPTDEAAGLKDGGDMFAISVKRQRKLKMKKHKYKKRMKATRNLRRRIERQKN